MKMLNEIRFTIIKTIPNSESVDGHDFLMSAEFGGRKTCFMYQATDFGYGPVGYLGIVEDTEICWEAQDFPYKDYDRLLDKVIDYLGSRTIGK